MAKGKFSNNGVDTFDEKKQYIGVRMQRGVPVLDRDWNEAEDVRRYFERMLRLRYIGDGVPDDTSFKIAPTPAEAVNDFLILPGRCTVNGFDVFNPRPTLYSEMTGLPKLPDTNVDTTFAVYVSPAVTRVTGAEDAALQNTQDINLETCVRDQLGWSVGATILPQLPPPGSFVLASITRPAGAKKITANMIQDTRRTPLNLRQLADDNRALQNQVAVLESKVQSMQLELDQVKKQLAKLLWEVKVEASFRAAQPFGIALRRGYFGENATITVTVTNLLGEPVVNCFLAFSADWGALDPVQAITDEKGIASIELIGVDSDVPPRRSEVGVLGKVADKLRRATLKETGSIQYADLYMETEEMSVLSRYTPSKSLVDLATNLPRFPVIDLPPTRTATVTVHAKDAEMGVVRGTGTVQVHFGLWVRDWARTKISTLVYSTDVGARVGDLLRRGVKTDKFDVTTVTDGLPDLFEQVHQDTHQMLKTHLFSNPNIADDSLALSGTLGRVIAEEAGASVGHKVNTALESQLESFSKDPANTKVTDQAKPKLKTTLVQTSSQISAGFTQRNRQKLNAFGK